MSGTNPTAPVVPGVTTPPAPVQTPAPAAGSTLLTEPGEAPDKDGAPASGATPPGDTKGTAADGGAGNTPADGKASEGTPPAELELKLPDGVQADTQLLDGFKGIAKDIGLDSAKAQKMLDLYVKAQTDAHQRAESDWTKQNEEWKQQIQADKEIGGAQMKPSLEAAKRAIAKFGSPGLAQVLNESGLGNHPELVRLLSRAGKALAEDSVAGTAGGATKKPTADEELKLLYPSMFPENK